MRSLTVSAFVAVFFCLVGAWIARTWFPVHKTVEIVRKVVETAPPEIVERVVFDTAYVDKWTTRVVYKNVRPTSILEIKAVEIDTLSWAILAVDAGAKNLSVDAYHVPSGRLLSCRYDSGPEWMLRVVQTRENDPLVLLVKRDLFDLRPRIYVGYSSLYGPTIRLRQRAWKLHVNWLGTEDGFGVEGEVLVW